MPYDISLLTAQKGNEQKLVDHKNVGNNFHTLSEERQCLHFSIDGIFYSFLCPWYSSCLCTRRSNCSLVFFSNAASTIVCGRFVWHQDFTQTTLIVVIGQYIWGNRLVRFMSELIWTFSCVIPLRFKFSITRRRMHYLPAIPAWFVDACVESRARLSCMLFG